MSSEVSLALGVTHEDHCASEPVAWLIMRSESGSSPLILGNLGQGGILVLPTLFYFSFLFRLNIAILIPA